MNLTNKDYSRFSQSKKGCKVFKIKFGKKSEILTDQSKNISVGDIKKKPKKNYGTYHKRVYLNIDFPVNLTNLI